VDSHNWADGVMNPSVSCPEHVMDGQKLVPELKQQTVESGLSITGVYLDTYSHMYVFAWWISKTHVVGACLGFGVMSIRTYIRM